MPITGNKAQSSSKPVKPAKRTPFRALEILVAGITAEDGLASEAFSYLKRGEWTRVEVESCLLDVIEKVERGGALAALLYPIVAGVASHRPIIWHPGIAPEMGSILSPLFPWVHE